MSTLKTSALRGTSGTGDSIQLHASDQSVTFPGAATVAGALSVTGTITNSGLWTGVPHASSWYTTAEQTLSASSEEVKNWAETTSPNYLRLGTAPTYSSDMFTLPATGWWEVQLHLVCFQTDATNDSWSIGIQSSTDSGSNFDNVANTGGRFDGAVTNLDHLKWHWGVTGLLKCTNASTFRFRPWLSAVNETYFRVHGDNHSTNENGGTSMYIKKIADI